MMILKMMNKIFLIISLFFVGSVCTMAHFMILPIPIREVRSSEGWTEYLVRSIRNVWLRQILGLLDLGTDVNAANRAGETPLSTASVWGSLRTIRLLINLGADRDTTNKNGKKPIDLAFEYNRSDRRKIARVIMQGRRCATGARKIKDDE